MSNRPTVEPAIHTIRSVDTHHLRRRVLRDGDSDANVVWDGDDTAGTVHLGVVAADRIVAISTWLAAPAPDGRVGFQLRGMATDPADAGRGHGSALLRAGVVHARSHGAEVVWANARVTALDFYTRAGFDATGPMFVTVATGLPHRLVVLPVGS